jgi:hypothetical protein
LDAGGREFRVARLGRCARGRYDCRFLEEPHYFTGSCLSMMLVPNHSDPVEPPALRDSRLTPFRVCGLLRAAGEGSQHLTPHNATFGHPPAKWLAKTALIGRGGSLIPVRWLSPTRRRLVAGSTAQVRAVCFLRGLVQLRWAAIRSAASGQAFQTRRLTTFVAAASRWHAGPIAICVRNQRDLK